MSEMLLGIELFRVPDKWSDDWAVWYGHVWCGRSPDEDDALIVKHLYGEDYEVSEVHNVRDVIEDRPSDFRIRTTTIDLSRAIPLPKKRVKEALESLNLVTKMRMAASVGTQHLAKFGGSEDWAKTLRGAISKIL